MSDIEVPAWFQSALADEPERSRVEVRGADVELLTWGRVGDPGLLFLHGFGGHADWWRFIAPFFAPNRRVAALSWSGMGGSDWRAAYSFPLYREEVLAAAEAAGLFASRERPTVVAHSFGTVPGMLTVGTSPERFGGLLIVDTPLNRGADIRRPRRQGRGRTAYSTLEEATARFRTLPATYCAAPFILEFLARTSVRRDGGDGAPFVWKFDPLLGETLVRQSIMEHLAAIDCPVAVMRGEHSTVLTRASMGWLAPRLPAHTRWIEVPEAGHHIMLDQPLAFVAAVRTLLEFWGEGLSDGRGDLELSA